MISSSLIGLLLNKWSLGIMGALGAFIYAYFKGRSSANTDNDLQKFEEERKLNSRLRSAEAKNQHLEKSGEKVNGKISSADTVDSLISLFNQVQSGESTDRSSRKNPKSDD